MTRTEEKIQYLCWLLCLCLLSACSDSEKFPNHIPSEGTDGYEGNLRSFVLDDGLDDFHDEQVVCVLKAQGDSIIYRECSHTRFANQSHFTLDEDKGLKEGLYRLLGFARGTIEEIDLTDMYGVGARLKVESDTAVILDKYSKEFELYGEGTKENPYLIAGANQLAKLRRFTNNEMKNKKLTTSTFFQQVADIDARGISAECSVKYGWDPIGNSPQTPFRGVYLASDSAFSTTSATISKLYIDRPTTIGIGLFGFVEGTVIKTLKIKEAEVVGGSFVGALVGAIQTPGDALWPTVLENCSVENCKVEGPTLANPETPADGFGTGGLVGVIDLRINVMLMGCSSSGCDIYGSYGVGGLVGISQIFSHLTLSDCQNNSGSVVSDFSGAGGLIGAADTLHVFASTNKAEVEGASRFYPSDTQHAAIGFGGIAGGTGFSFIIMSINEGNVSGYEGVGGLVGSARIKGSETESSICNNVVITGSGNMKGTVKGQRFVGGLCGEAQFGASNAYNAATVEAKEDYAGGLVGRASVLSVHNSGNSGSVTSNSYVGGIAGYMLTGQLSTALNKGFIQGNGDYVGGALGRAGNDIMVNYCGNFGIVSNRLKGKTGGLIGEVGDPREWSGWDIFECVMGSLEIVMAVAGPVISITSVTAEAAAESAKTAGAAAKAAKIAKIAHVTHYIHYVAASIEIAINIIDLIPWIEGIIEICTPEIKEEMKQAIQGKGNEIASSISEKLSTMIPIWAWTSSYPLATSPIHATYQQHMNRLMTYCSDDEQMDDFNIRMNWKVDDRYEEMESTKKTEETIHSAISGICIFCGAVIACASIPITGGASLLPAFAGAFYAAVGGANSISKAVDNFQVNAAVISQCVNMGAISGQGDQCGGIIGYLQDACLLEDCLNGGMKQGDGGSIVGSMGMRSAMRRCLNIGRGWGTTFCASGTLYTPEEDVYTYEPNTTASGEVLSDNEISKESSYKHWDFDSEKGLWQIPTADDGIAFPVPFHSEMEFYEKKE